MIRLHGFAWDTGYHTEGDFGPLTYLSLTWYQVKGQCLNYSEVDKSDSKFWKNT